MRKTKLWSEGEVAKLQAMLANGEDLEAIADATGRTRQSVENKMRDLGLAPRAWGGARVVAEAKHLIPPRPVYRSLTSVMMGDPPVGRSALDQRSGAA